MDAILNIVLAVLSMIMPLVGTGVTFALKPKLLKYTTIWILNDGN